MKKEKILEMLQSDDIEIVALYTDILLQKTELKVVVDILKKDNKHFITKEWHDKKYYIYSFYKLGEEQKKIKLHYELRETI